MTKFIKLTEAYEHKDVPLIINAAFIRSIKVGDKGRETLVNLTETKFYFVKETVEQIWERINTDTTKAPVIMTAVEALEYYKMKDGC